MPMDVQRRLSEKQMPQGSNGQRSLLPQKPVPPRFCAAHGSSEKRPKVEPRTFQCENCRVQLQTNYAEARLCPPCSEREGRCMCCGAPAPLPPGTVALGEPPAGQAPLNSMAAREVTPLPPAPLSTAAMLQQQPVFCSRHGKSELRPKVEPQERECRSCQVKLQTNYAEFAVCPGCSRRDGRCMICGSLAEPLPPPAPAAPASADASLEHELSLPPPPPPPEDFRRQQRQRPPAPPPEPLPPPPGRLSASSGFNRERSLGASGAPPRPDASRRPHSSPRGMPQPSTDPMDRLPDRPPEPRDWASFTPPRLPSSGTSQVPLQGSWSSQRVGGPTLEGATPPWASRQSGRRRAPPQPDRW